jgi:hypothetical protein
LKTLQQRIVQISRDAARLRQLLTLKREKVSLGIEPARETGELAV